MKNYFIKNKKRYASFLIASIFVFAFFVSFNIPQAYAATEVKKPSASSDPGGVTTTNPANAYDTAAAGDTTTFSRTVYGQGGTKISIYHTFSAAGQTYTALSLKLKYSAQAGTNDAYIVDYSTSGATNCSDYGTRTWVSLVPASHAAATLATTTVALSTGQNLTQLCVKYYSTKSGGSDNKNFDIYDIWTEGTYTPPTTKFVIIDPADGTVDAPITVTVQAQRADNSIDTSYQNDVILNASGSATGGGLVDIVNGVGTLNISDTAVQTVNLSLTDSQSTGLDVSSTQSVIFGVGVIAKFVINNPGDFYAKTRAGYTVTRKDNFNNIVVSGTGTVYLYSSSFSSSKKFYDAASGGNIITSINITPGHFFASFWYYDETPGTYTITVSDSSPAPNGDTGIDDSEDLVAVMPVAVKFVIIDPADGTVDNPITITVQAQKPDNSVDVNYQEDVTLVVSGSATGGGLINIVNGVGTKNISDTVAETTTLSLTDSQSTGLDVSSTRQVIFAGGAISQFTLDDPGPLSAGSRIGYTVTRKDQYNNLTASGVNRVYLYSSSSGANKKFFNAASDGDVITFIDITDTNSTANFWYYDETPGTYTITASDNSSYPDGNTNINDAVDSTAVSAGSVSQFSLNDPGDVYAGTRLGYTVTRKDQYNNLANSGNTTVYLYSSSLSGSFYDAAISGNIITCIDITDGNSAVNFWYYDETPGNYTITAYDNLSGPDGAVGIADGTDSVIMSAVPIVATRFVILNPIDGTVDAPITVTVQAQDNSGNIDTTIQSDVTLVASGSATGDGLVDVVNGVGTKNISDTAVQTVNLSLTDSQSTGLNVDSTQDVVFSVGGVGQFSLDNPGDMSAGTRIKYTVTRKDQFGNLTTTGLTKIYFYGLPAEITKKFYDSELGGSVITFVNIPDGSSSADFWYYDEKAETSSVVVSDNATAPDGTVGIDDVSDSVAVSAGSVAKFILNNPGDMTTNTKLGYTVSRQDQFGNSITAGVTLVYLYTSSTGTNTRFYDSATVGLAVTSIPVDDGKSSANFWYYDEAPGTWVITVSDGTPTANGSAGVADDADSVTVSAIPIVATRFVILDPGPSQINAPVSVTVKAEDANGNIDTTYQSDVTLVASGSATGAGLVNIVNGVGSLSINDATAETVNLSLSDTETTGLNVSSTAQINFSALPPVFTTGGGGYVPPVGGVTFSGVAYPGAILSIAAIKDTENIIKQATVSSADGSFKITFTGLSAGARAFALLVQDKDGRIAQSKVYDLNLLNADSILEVNDIIVSPTIGFPRTTITKGDFLAVVGSAAPSSRLEIEVDGQLINTDIVAGTDGAYKYLYNTASLDFGSHTIRARQITFDGVHSEFSPQKVFFTTNLLVPKTDFNNDGKLNISDWSIFLSRWVSTNPAIRLLDDLNGDGKLDATDFSIFIRTIRI